MAWILTAMLAYQYVHTAGEPAGTTDEQCQWSCIEIVTIQGSVLVLDQFIKQKILMAGDFQHCYITV